MCAETQTQLWSNPQLGPVVSSVDDFFASYGRSEKIDNSVTNVCGMKAAGVYTRVQAYLTWIHSVMAGAKLALRTVYYDICGVKEEPVDQEILGAPEVSTIIRAMCRVGVSNTATTRNSTNVPNSAGRLKNAAASNTVSSTGLDLFSFD